jgi:hypothetical protein
MKTTGKSSADASRKPAKPKDDLRENLDLSEFPHHTLEQALIVPKTLREIFADGPATWPRIAEAMNIGAPEQNRYLLWSAQDYNLLDRDDESFSLSELARKLLTASTPEELRDAAVQAVLTPILFSRFFTDYAGNLLPNEELLDAVLARRYSVPPDRVAEAKTLLRENGLFAGILRPQPDGTLRVHLHQVETDVVPEPVLPQAALPDPAQPNYKKMCFVITPIGDDDSIERKHANLVLKGIIEPVVRDLDLDPVRGDQIDRSGIINQQVFECLAKARIAIADLSFANPNAFYELGIRHMCKLPTVQIIRKGDKIPFDVSQGRTLKIDIGDVYSLLDSIDSAKRELRQYLKHALSSAYRGEDNPVNTYLPGVVVQIP